jgi:hypothetical protein
MYINTASFLWSTVEENIDTHHSHERVGTTTRVVRPGEPITEAPSYRHHLPGQSISYMHQNDKKDIS